MEKDWYKSKAVLGAILVALGGVVTAFGGFLQGDVDLVAVVTALGTASGILGIRTAQK